jgi:hypothetical protein
MISNLQCIPTDSSLFDRFLDEKNFILAYKRIAAKGSRGGIDRVSVEEFGRHLKP